MVLKAIIIPGITFPGTISNLLKFLLIPDKGFILGILIFVLGLLEFSFFSSFFSSAGLSPSLLLSFSFSFFFIFSFASTNSFKETISLILSEITSVKSSFKNLGFDISVFLIFSKKDFISWKEYLFLIFKSYFNFEISISISPSFLL